MGNLGRIIWQLSRQSVTEFLAPYDYVTSVAWESLKYFFPEDVEFRRWAIVGGHLGKEIPTIASSYPQVQLEVFECSRRYFPALSKKFNGIPGINIHNKAVGEIEGKANFFETTLDGSGSLLPLGDLHRRLFFSKQAESFEVEVTTLDDFFHGVQLDVLQIDVQGAEMAVLRGADKVLERVRAVLIEVSHDGQLYLGGSAFQDIRQLLEGRGFLLAVLGVDKTLTGNALFIRPDL